MSLFPKFFQGSKKSRSTVHAKPHHRKKKRKIRPSRVYAYMLVVDESSSTGRYMRRGFGPTTTRIAAIQKAGHDYVRQLGRTNRNQLVGLVGFSDNATLYHPPAIVGKTARRLHCALDRLHPQNMTNLSAGIELALQQLRNISTRYRNMVVITDGAANVQHSRLPSLIQQAKSLGVRVFTIGVGNNGDYDYDRDLLQTMANATGGRFNSAHSFATLQRALRKAC